MRACIAALGMLAALSVSPAAGHGPQIQVTIDNNKLTTRQLIPDGPYSTSLTAAKSVYVIPMAVQNGVWYSRPNNAISPITLQPAFPSGPGVAYGFDLADGGPQSFATGSALSISFLTGLKTWNGAAFVDAGAVELKGFLGSNANISSPTENFAVTTDVAPFDSLALPAIAAGYGSESAEVHNSIRWALLGDGNSATSASPDGVYLTQLQISTSLNGVAASDPYYFVLSKNVSAAAVSAAVQSLGVAPALVQNVPEPAVCAMLTFAAGIFASGSGYRRANRQRN